MSNPMYRQIAEDLRAQIESGKLRPGQQLRTELELREHYGASRNTVRDAIKWLISLGLVETRARSTGCRLAPAHGGVRLRRFPASRLAGLLP
jgi:DNA-binding GntR family transcriptional regulator